MATYRFDHVEVRPAERAVFIRGSRARVGSRAFDVLVTLLERRDRVVRKAEILDAVWPDEAVEENNLQLQVSILRKLVGRDAITTVPRRGYRFTAPVQQSGESERAGGAGIRP